MRVRPREEPRFLFLFLVFLWVRKEFFFKPYIWSAIMNAITMELSLVVIDYIYNIYIYKLKVMQVRKNVNAKL